MRKAAFAVLALFALLMVGCAGSGGNDVTKMDADEEFNFVMSKIHQVLEGHGFHPREARGDASNRYIYAQSDVQVQGTYKTRQVIKAWPSRTREGFYEPVVRVFNQVDIGDDVSLNNRRGARTEWQDVNEDGEFAVKLYNEIMPLINQYDPGWTHQDGRSYPAGYNDDGDNGGYTMDPNSQPEDMDQPENAGAGEGEGDNWNYNE